VLPAAGGASMTARPTQASARVQKLAEFITGTTCRVYQ
jgi:hypothetical protein